MNEVMKSGGGVHAETEPTHDRSFCCGLTQEKAHFLSWIGADTYELINKLFSAPELDAASFDDVTGKLDEYFKQSLHELAASNTIYQCKM